MKPTDTERKRFYRDNDYIVNLDTIHEEVNRLERAQNLPLSDFSDDLDAMNDRRIELTLRPAKPTAPPTIKPPSPPPVATPSPPTEPMIGDTKLTGLARAIFANTKLQGSKK
jgi:hypothetical protein